MQLQDAAKEIALWRKKKVSLAVMAVTTTLWVLLQVYGFNLITLASWASMFTVTCLFLYGTILRLLHNHVLNSITRSDAEEGAVGWKVTEKAAKEAAESGKRAAEEGIRWMFRVSAESEWYVFVGVVAALLLLSYVARFFDFFSVVYAGTMVGMTAPVMYMRYERRIRECADGGRAWFNERVVRKVSHRVNGITDADADGVKVDHPQPDKKTD